jgi:hypothetical protein
VVAGLALVLPAGVEAASAIITTNTLDPLASHKQDGRLVRVTGPSGCTRGERVSIGRRPAAGDRGTDPAAAGLEARRDHLDLVVDPLGRAVGGRLFELAEQLLAPGAD